MPPAAISVRRGSISRSSATRRQLLDGNLIELDAIDTFPTRTYARERARLFCVRFHKQLLFDALRLDARQLLDKRVEAAHEFHMILEHEHSFGKAQTMRNAPPAMIALVSRSFAPGMLLRVVRISQRGFTACAAFTIMRVFVATADRWSNVFRHTFHAACKSAAARVRRRTSRLPRAHRHRLARL